MQDEIHFKKKFENNHETFAFKNHLEGQFTQVPLLSHLPVYSKLGVEFKYYKKNDGTQT